MKRNIICCGLSKDSIYKGEDIVIMYDGYALCISEGCGDNLFDEDIERGFNDYFNLDVYHIEDVLDSHVSGLAVLPTIGGGIMLRTKLVSEEFYGKTVEEVVEVIFEANEPGDFFDLYASGLPDYKILAFGRNRVLVDKRADEYVVYTAEIYAEHRQSISRYNELHGID